MRRRRAGKAADVEDSRITPGVLYRAVLLAFGLVVAALIVRQLLSLVLAVMIVVIIALPLSACATFLGRFGVPRALGGVLALLVGLGAVVGLVVLTVPVFSHQVNQFVNSLPSIIDALRHRLGKLTGTSPSHIGTQIQQFVNGYTHHPTRLLGPLEVIGASVAAALAAIVVVILTALYTAIHPEPLRNGLVRLVPPSRRFEAEQILDRLRTAYLGWLRGVAIGMVVLFVVTYAGLKIVGLGFAEFFAVFTAVAMIVPYFGALASSIPPILYALTYSPEKAILVAIIYVIAHQIEGNVIEPLVVARTVQLHPALVAVGVIAVEQLFGPVGLIVAVPIIATIKILIEELWVNPVERRSEAAVRREPPPRSPGELVVGPSPLRRRGT
jgi:predicted PurR-regulated permease PerM